MWNKSCTQTGAEQLNNVLLWVQMISLKITPFYGKGELIFQNYVFKGKGRSGGWGEEKGNLFKGPKIFLRCI